MLVLALDTATTAMTAGVVELGAGGVTTALAARTGAGSRAHAEHLAPWIRAVLAEVGAAPADLDAVVCGVGPGPFTGLRVGLMTAAALGDALDRPVHGVGTHDALARARPEGGVLTVTDARRREVYWTATARVGPLDTTAPRTHGPRVSTPAALAAALTDDPDLRGIRTAVGDAAATMAALVDDLVVDGPTGPSPAGLVAVAASDLLVGRTPAPLVPLYLRRPDAVPPGAPKAVSRPA